MELQHLISAVLSGDGKRVFETLQRLDRVLTGAFCGAFAERPDGSIEQVRGEIRDFLRVLETSDRREVLITYLGDGGLSRLVIESCDRMVALRLTSNSSRLAKKNWAKLEEANETHISR